jgi:acetylornithine deacetylase/succinyl-diaminopimelate desuccinylase-like protein
MLGLPAHLGPRAGRQGTDGEKNHDHQDDCTPRHTPKNYALPYNRIGGSAFIHILARSPTAFPPAPGPPTAIFNPTAHVPPIVRRPQSPKQAAPTLTGVLEHLETNRESYVKELQEFVQIPSISADPAYKDDVRRAAEWMKARLEQAGLERVELVETSRHPAVVAEWMHAGDDKPTLVIYGHYDVQPADAETETWRHPPFQAVVEDERVWGRGTTDDKGQLLTHIQAVEAYLKTHSALPVNVRFVFEGEEEIGSLNFQEVIERAGERLKGDLLVVSDSPMRGEDEPAITNSLRGLCYLFVDIEGPHGDLHSGTWGGILRNPLEALAHMLATLKDPHSGRVLVPGFYDDVVEPTPEERARIQEIAHDGAYYLESTGVDALFGEVGWTNEERIGLRPTLEINGIRGGYTGEGAKTVIGSRAHAKLSARLVADQDPQKIYHAIKNHLEKQAPTGVKVHITLDTLGHPVRAGPHHPLVRIVEQALEETFGRRPALIPEGGSIPAVAQMQRRLGLVPVLAGFGQRDENMHAPDESFRLKNYERGREASARLIAHLSEK